MPFASQPKPKLLHYEVAGFVRAFFASSRFCATIFWSNTPAVFFHWSSNAGSSRRGAAGFRLVQKMAASKIPKKGPALFFIQKFHIAEAGFVCSLRSARHSLREAMPTPDRNLCGDMRV